MVLQEFTENSHSVTVSCCQYCCQITFPCNMHNTAVTQHLSGHFQVEITSCCSQRCRTISTCNIFTEAMVQQQSKKSTWPLRDAALRGVRTLFSALYTSAMFLQLSDNTRFSFFSYCFERCATNII